MALSVVARGGGTYVLGDTVVDVQTKTFDFDADIRPLIGAVSAEIPTFFLTYAADATVGTRMIVIDLLDSAGTTILLRASSVGTVAASTTTAFSFIPKGFSTGGAVTLTTGAATTIFYEAWFPGFIVESGMKLRFSVSATGGTAGAGDDMSVYLHLRALYGNI